MSNPLASPLASASSRLSQPFPLAAAVVALTLGCTIILFSTALPPTARALTTLMLTWWMPGALLVSLWRLPEADALSRGVLALGLGLGWLILIALGLHALPGAISLVALLAAFGGGNLLLAALSVGRLASAPPHPSPGGGGNRDWANKGSAPPPSWVRLGGGKRWPRPASLSTRNAKVESKQTLKPSIKEMGFAPSRFNRSATITITLALLLLAGTLRLYGLGYHEFHRDEVSVLQRALESIAGDEAALAAHYKGPGEILITSTVYRAVGTANETTARLPFALASVASVVAIFALGRRLHSTALGAAAGALLAINGFAVGLSRIDQYQGVMLLLMTLAVLAGWHFAESGRARWLVLTAVLSAFGVVMHYEFALMTPLLLLLAWQGWRRSERRGAVAAGAAIVGVLGAVLVLGTYLPVLRNDNFEQTQGYLGNRLGTGLNFNVAFFAEMGTFYNSAYFFFGLCALVATALVLGARAQQSQPRRVAWLAALWFLPYFVLYLFVMRFPGTHFYMMMPAWSLLGALPLVMLLRIKPASWRWASKILIIALVTLWLGVSTHYVYVMFLRQQPEYLINYPKTRLAFYPTTYGNAIPQEPRFGFPIYEGWQALGTLAEWGYLGEGFASNERSRHLSRWYLAAVDREDTLDTAQFAFVARHLQQPLPGFDRERVEREFTKIGDVRVRGEPRIDLYARHPLPVPYLTLDAELFDAAFDRTQSLVATGSPAQATGPVALSDQLTLQSARILDSKLSAGDVLHVELDWLPQQPLLRDYKLFVHVVPAAAPESPPLLQWNGYPGFNTQRTSTWPAGKIFTDHVLLRVANDLAAGEYLLRAGLYDPESGARVGEQSVAVGTVAVN